MPDKDINIHIGAPGAARTQEQIDSVARSLGKVGSVAEDINKSTDAAFADGLKRIEKIAKGAATGTGKLTSEVGVLGRAFTMLRSHLTGLIAGFIAFGTISIGKGILKFFDDLKTRQDGAVKANEALRKSYQDLFEVMNQFGEQGRKQTVMATEKLLTETSTSAEVGMPAIEEYIRQFKSSMTPADYQAGVRQMLSYANRHGGAATPDLIQLMRGYEMNTPAQQGEFMRKITAAGGQAGLTDREMIDALGRAAPGARAMGMSPEETLSIVAAVAAGEIGRNKTAMPATVLDAMAAPNAEALKKYRIGGETPGDISSAIAKKAADLSASNRYKMLQAVYGDSAAKGVYKIMTGGVVPVSPISEAADKAEQAEYEQTIEAKLNKVDAANRRMNANTSKEEERLSRGWKRAKAMREKYTLEHPVKNYLIDWLPLPKIAEDALAAQQYIKEHPEERPLPPAQSTVNITHNNNVIYHRPAQSAAPRIVQGDLQ
jgi:hypothetical protein